MKIVFGTQTRSGSEFLVHLTRALLSGLPEPYSAITPGRGEALLKENRKKFRSLYDRGEGWRYFEECGIAAAKIEDPGIDFFGYNVAVMYPQARWLATIRRIEDIITSHYNIKSWGFSEEQVLRAYLSGIGLYEELVRSERLFVLNIDAPERFRLDELAGFLGCEITKKANHIASAWAKVNALDYQQKKHGEGAQAKKTPPDLETLRNRHPWIDDVESRYLRLNAE